MQFLTFDQLQKLVSIVSPTSGSPGSPLETTQWLRSLQPSLMPRTSVHQGAASGLAILAARAASNRVDLLANRALRRDVAELPAGPPLLVDAQLALPPAEPDS